MGAKMGCLTTSGVNRLTFVLWIKGLRLGGSGIAGSRVDAGAEAIVFGITVVDLLHGLDCFSK